MRPQHCLNFLPLPHGQGSLRPTLYLGFCAAGVALGRMSFGPSLAGSCGRGCSSAALRG